MTQSFAELQQEFRSIAPLLDAMFEEFRELSKKKPDGQVGATKVKIVNRLLGASHKMLLSEPNVGFLDLLDEDDLPKNSDVVLILSQFVAAMETYRRKFGF